MEVRTKEKSTAILEAVRRGAIGSVELLLRAGAQPNVRNEDGFTPLVVAARKGNHHTARLLLRRGADPHLTDNMNLTALFWARKRGHRCVEKLLISVGCKKLDKNQQSSGRCEPRCKTSDATPEKGYGSQ